MEVLLIISQYRWSRHMFVCEEPTDEEAFYENSRKFIEEIEAYKRSPGDNRPVGYGDMDMKYFKGLDRRYNVNDAGDIYIIPCGSIANALKEIKEYWDTSRREAQGYKRKDHEQSIWDHHNISVIRPLVQKYFTIL